MSLYSINRNMSFHELWEEVKGCYRSLDFRCIATKEGDSWKNIFFTAFLSRRNIDDVKKETEQDYKSLMSLGIDEIKELGIFYNVDEAQNLPRYIEQIQNGQMVLLNNTIHLREGWEKTSIYGSPRTIRFGEYGEYPLINYEFYSRDSARISEALRNELSSLCFLETINELGRQWLKMPNLEGYGLNGIIVFPIYFNVINALMRDNEFDIKLKLHEYLYPRLNILIGLRRNVRGNYLIMENKRFSSKDILSSNLDEDLLTCEVKHIFKISPMSEEDEICFWISSKLGMLYHDRITMKRELKGVPFLKKLILSYLEKYGYQPDKNYRVDNVDNNVNSLEWHVYHLLSPIFPIIWIGLKEDYWRGIFKDLGFDETVDFISFTNNSVILVECVQKYTTDKGDVGERKVRKLLYLKEKFYELGFITYPLLICGENYEDNKVYFEGKIRKDVYFIFNEGLKQMQEEVHLIKKPEDLIRYSKGNSPKIESY